MASFSNNTVTIEGRKLLVNSLVNGTGIEFTHFAIGDGEAPAAPENATALTNELFTVGVSKTQASDKEKGVTLVRGSFTNTSEKGNFYWRELGIYARTAGTEETPILFGYANTGAEADFIPAVGISSVVEQGIMLQIVTGSATVLYVSDPTARATLQDIDDCLKEVEARLAAFTEESLNDIAAQVQQLQDAIAAASAELSKATEGFVLKAGDTMTGDLNMGENKVIGSATHWNGWRLFTSFAELNTAAGLEGEEALTNTSTMIQIMEAMPTPSKFLYISTSDSAIPIDDTELIGILEVRKSSSDFCEFMASKTGGQRYAATWDTENGFIGWNEVSGMAAGSMLMFAGEETPIGWFRCDGRYFHPNGYPQLFAAIGYRYGKVKFTADDPEDAMGWFRLPDFRGMFPRGYDDGRGIDSGRELGTDQASGAPNITATFPGVGQKIGGMEYEMSGAVYTVNTVNSPKGGVKVANTSTAERDDIFGFDASRSSSVYQNGVNEVRPANIAVNFIIKY